MTSGRVALFAVVLGGLLAVSASAELRLTASLKDAERLAQKASATVEAKVSGIAIVDPASVNEQPKPGQGHLHYRVDDGPVIATTAEKLGFHDLAPGEHRFELTLVGNDHKPLLPSQTLELMVPSLDTSTHH
jgi:hypothetical protein